MALLKPQQHYYIMSCWYSWLISLGAILMYAWFIAPYSIPYTTLMMAGMLTSTILLLPITICTPKLTNHPLQALCFDALTGLGLLLAIATLSLYWSENLMRILVILLGSISLLLALYKLVQTRWTALTLPLLLTLAGLTLLLVIENLYGHAISRPFLASYLYSSTHLITRDQLFYAAMASMLKTYHLPSSGVDGVAYHSTYWGSLWINAGLSNLLKTNMFSTLTLIFSCLYTPLLIKNVYLISLQILTTSKQNPGYLKLFCLFIITAICIMLYTFANLKFTVWPAAFLQNTYSISVGITLVFTGCVYFCLSSEAEKRTRLYFAVLIVPVLLLLIGATKVSNVYIAGTAYACVLMVTKNLLKPVYLTSLLLCAIAALLAHHWFLPTLYQSFSVQRFAFFQAYVQHTGPFLLLYFLLAWMYVLTKLASIAISKGQSTWTDVFLFVIAACICMIPACTLVIGGGSGAYLIDPLRMISLLLFIYALNELFTRQLKP
jgi:hypothetical protein